MPGPPPGSGTMRTLNIPSCRWILVLRGSFDYALASEELGVLVDLEAVPVMDGKQGTEIDVKLTR